MCDYAIARLIAQYAKENGHELTLKTAKIMVHRLNWGIKHRAIAIRAMSAALKKVA